MRYFHFFIAFIFCFSFSASLFSQTKINTKNSIVSLSVSGRKIDPRGYLMNTTDSTLILSTTESIMLKDQRTFGVEDVEFIEIQGRRRTENMAAGAAIGLGAALALSLSARGNNTLEERTVLTLLASVIAVPVGVLIGAAISDDSEIIPVKNSRKTYAKQRAIIEKLKYQQGK